MSEPAGDTTTITIPDAYRERIRLMQAERNRELGRGNVSAGEIVGVLLDFYDSIMRPHPEHGEGE